MIRSAHAAATPPIAIAAIERVLDVADPHDVTLPVLVEHLDVRGPRADVQRAARVAADVQRGRARDERDRAAADGERSDRRLAPLQRRHRSALSTNVDVRADRVASRLAAGRGRRIGASPTAAAFSVRALRT